MEARGTSLAHPIPGGRHLRRCPEKKAVQEEQGGARRSGECVGLSSEEYDVF